MKKPKTMKIVLLGAAVLTVVLSVMSIAMLKAVNGDALFYMDSGKGYFYAVSYRWVCLAAGLLLLFWIVLGVARRKAIMAMLPKVELKTKEAGKTPGEAQAVAEVKAEVKQPAAVEAKTAEEPKDAAEMEPGTGPRAVAETKPEAGEQAAAEMKKTVETQVSGETNTTEKMKETETVQTIAVSDAVGTVEPAKVFCTNCGKQITAEARFCPFCGSSTKAKGYAAGSG